MDRCLLPRFFKQELGGCTLFNGFVKRLLYQAVSDAFSFISWVSDEWLLHRCSVITRLLSTQTTYFKT